MKRRRMTVTRHDGWSQIETEIGWIQWGRDGDGDLFVNVNTEDATVPGMHREDGTPDLFVYLNDATLNDPEDLTPRDRSVIRETVGATIDRAVQCVQKIIATQDHEAAANGNLWLQGRIGALRDIEDELAAMRPGAVEATP